MTDDEKLWDEYQEALKLRFADTVNQMMHVWSLSEVAAALRAEANEIDVILSESIEKELLSS